MKVEKKTVTYHSSKGSVCTPEKTLRTRKTKKACPSCDMQRELARATIDYKENKDGEQ